MYNEFKRRTAPLNSVEIREMSLNMCMSTYASLTEQYILYSIWEMEWKEKIDDERD